MKTRQLAPDFIKGLAIILMVYGHLTMVGTWASWQNDATGWIYSFHMPLFLMISGMFFSGGSDPFWKMKKLLLRIGVPYVLFISLYLVGLKLIQFVGIPTSNAPPGSVSEFVETILLHPRGGYWFLHSLLLIQLSLLLARAGAKWMKTNDAASILLVSALLLLLLVTFGLVQARTILYFLIGMAIQFVAGRTLKTPLLVGLGGIVLVWVLDHCLQLDGIRNFTFVEVVWCVSILFGSWAWADRFSESKGTSIIAWVGRNSLSVLVFHAIFIVLLKPVAGWCVRLEPTGWLYSIGATFIVTTLCLISAFICDKTRLSRYLFRTPRCYMPLQQSETHR